MRIGENVINILASVVAIEYMDHGFEKRTAVGGIGFCLQEGVPPIFLL